MPQNKKCPYCSARLPSNVLIMVRIKNIGSPVLLACDNCGYDLVDPTKYRIWVFKGMMMAVVLGMVAINIFYNIWVFFPIAAVIFLVLYFDLPLKDEVIQTK